jgi:hypothetical protein
MFVHLSKQFTKGGCNNIHDCVSEQQGKYGLVCQFQQPLQVVGGQDIVPGDGQKVC